MNPEEKKPAEIYQIIDRQTGEVQGSYNRAYSKEFYFTSAKSARSANVNHTFEDKEKYKIARYRVTYELIDDDVD